MALGFFLVVSGFIVFKSCDHTSLLPFLPFWTLLRLSVLYVVDFCTVLNI